MATVFRVEHYYHNQWQGMYHDFYGFPVYIESHPGPNTDVLLKEFWRTFDCSEQSKYYFGFKNIQQFNRWCQPWNAFYNIFTKQQFQEQFALCVYETSDWLEGYNQIVFEKDKSSLILRSTDFSDLNLFALGKQYGN